MMQFLIGASFSVHLRGIYLYLHSPHFLSTKSYIIIHSATLHGPIQVYTINMNVRKIYAPLEICKGYSLFYSKPIFTNFLETFSTSLKLDEKQISVALGK
jgi:hypothetical protein